MPIELTIEQYQSPLDNIELYEQIDVKKLDKLINSNLLLQEIHNPMIQTKFSNEKDMLMKYRKLVKNGYAKVKYEKVKSMGGFGRVIPNRGLGLFCIRREIRHTIASDYYVDIDIVNAHPDILCQICQAHKIEHKVLANYVANRQQRLDEVMNAYEVDKDSAKRLFIRMLYFGSYDTWASEENINDFEPLDFMVAFKKEIKRIGTTIMNNNPELADLVDKSKKSKNNTTYNKLGSVVSYFLQEYEFRILTEMYLYLLKHNYIQEKNCVLCADGIMIKKEYYDEKILACLEKVIHQRTGFNVSLVQKEMNEGYDEIEEVADQTTNESEYSIIKRTIEKQYFFIENLGKFGRYYEDTRELVLMSESTFILNMRPYKVQIEMEDGATRKFPFSQLWLDDENRRSYESIVFNPNSNSRRHFNLFTGFEFENAQYTQKSTAIIHKILDHVLQDAKLHVLQWFSFIIKNRKKTDVAIILYSNNHGVGKNSITELLTRLIDQKYSTKIENIDDLASNFNSFLESKFLCYGDEIIAKSKDLYNSLKNTITRTQVKINRKGIDSYMCNDLANYIFTTNEHHPFKIETNDRRMSMIHCNEEKLPSSDYKEFHEALEDRDVLITFFNELMNMETPHRITCIETDIKRDIQEVYIPAPIKYLYANYETLENNVISVADLFNEIQAFEKSKGYTETKTTKYMSMAIGKVYDFSHRTKNGRGYKFTNLSEHLKNYNLETFENCAKIQQDDMVCYKSKSSSHGLDE